MQQELMLLGLKACFERRAFAEVEKAAQLKTKLRQGREQHVRIC